jgi:hypothetical protein
LGRWAIFLADNNYKIKYRPGRIHQNADCLLRLRVSHVRIENSEIDIWASQAADPLCQAINNYLENEILSEKDKKNGLYGQKKLSYVYFVKNHILYRIDEPTEKSRRHIPCQQVVLLLILRPTVLKEMHDSPLSGGHLAFYALI